MKNRMLVIILLICISGIDIISQITIEEIQNRATPQWWKDSKFGIFIHWGVYSVPSFADHDYAEWYSAHISEGESRKFHREVYGENYDYYDFVDQFKAEFFDPAEWASIIKSSGAKYVILTAKHMEGFTLWESDIANELHGRKWNAVEAGPRRDVVKELSDAVNENGLKFGLYFMLYEALTPKYLRDPLNFIDEYSIPQFKDLYSTYNPSIIWVDGSWQHTVEEYGSYELIDWALKTLPNAEELVFNDRWGTDAKLIGHATTEYTYMLDPDSLPEAWEECRGIGESFGFNRNEKLKDYSTSQELILILCDVVSNGGNLLLNIGPTADGRIPIFMQERLIEIGKWLRINGEAIFGSEKYKIPTQWSTGRRADINPKNLEEPITDGIAERKYILENFNILKLTIDPDEEQAVKEIMFTQKGKSVYAITPKFPQNRLIVKDIKPGIDTKITMLGTDVELKWEYKNSQIIISVPSALIFELPFQYAYTFKITNTES